jgi:ketol-acid reductoisomerase
MAKYEIEREAGLPPEAILMEQYLSREMAYIFEKAATQGFVEQLGLHSQTSQYGQLEGIDAFDGSGIRAYMRETYEQIDNGKFAREWTNEQAAGYPTLNRLYKKYRESEMFRMEQRTIDEFGLREE